ncbi:hypothetical protein BDW66DRAFT_168378 [Aspergillus desertorum]
MDYGMANPHTRPYYGCRRHQTVTARSVPGYVNRSALAYSLAGQERILHPNNLASPRYSPNVQSWKRQQRQSSPSFIPSTSPCSEQSEYTMSQPKRLLDCGTACISPFRSVRRMKEPFKFRLPASPFTGNNLPASSESRRIARPHENRTLLPWRSDQNSMASGLETFGLLPSPPLSDSQPSQASPAREIDCSCLSHAMSCGRCTPQNPAIEVSVQNREVEATDVHMAHSTFVRQCDLVNGRFTASATDSGGKSLSVTCSDVDLVGKRNFSGSSAATQRSRSGTVSGEGSWAPNSLSYCETWLQGAPMDSAGDEAGRSAILSRRKFQIVQKSPLIADWKRAYDDAVLAVKNKMKPKLVDISRQFSPAMSYSFTTSTHTIPATPDHSPPEVSAFSPDTPLELSDSGYATYNPVSLPKSQRADGEAVNLCPVTSEIVDKTNMSDLAAGHGDDSEPETKPSPPSKIASSSEAQTIPRASSTKPDKEELEKLWDQEWTIDQLEHSVKEFPQKASTVLSGCGNYLLSLPTFSRKATNMQPRVQVSRLDTVPEKATSILGMKFAQPQLSRVRDQVLKSQSSKLLEDLDSILDSLLFTLLLLMMRH